MFVKMPHDIEIDGRVFRNGETINVGKHPKLAGYLDRLKRKAQNRSPQDKMVRADEVKKK